MDYMFSKDYYNNHDKEMMMNYNENEQNHYTLSSHHLSGHMHLMHSQHLPHIKEEYAPNQQQQQYLTHEMEHQYVMENEKLEKTKQSSSLEQYPKKASNSRQSKRQAGQPSNGKTVSRIASKENLADQNQSKSERLKYFCLLFVPLIQETQQQQGQQQQLQQQQTQQQQTKAKGGNSKASLANQRNNNDSEGHASQNSTLPEEQNFNYYHEFCRLFTANVVLTNQLKELVGQKTDLITKFTKLEKKTEELGDHDADDKKKRFRRIASQIDRHYKCPNTSCQKSYGSEGSLNQHLKIKHPELYQGGPTNSEMDSEQNNNYYTNNMESFQEYQNDDDEEEEIEEDEEEEQEVRQLASSKQRQRGKK